MKSISLQTAKSLTPNCLLIALGSNYQAEIFLNFARQQLATFGKGQFSSVFINPDYRNPNNPQYSNQCAIIFIEKKQLLAKIIQQLKLLEITCQRQKNQPLVTLDIDVLAIKIEKSPHWQIIDKRYPFKPHEMIGINELFASTYQQDFISQSDISRFIAK